MLIRGGRISGGGEGWEVGIEISGEGFGAMPVGVDVRDAANNEDIDQPRDLGCSIAGAGTASGLTDAAMT